MSTASSRIKPRLNCTPLVGGYARRASRVHTTIIRAALLTEAARAFWWNRSSAIVRPSCPRSLNGPMGKRVVAVRPAKAFGLGGLGACSGLGAGCETKCVRNDTDCWRDTAIKLKECKHQSSERCQVLTEHCRAPDRSSNELAPTTDGTDLDPSTFTLGFVLQGLCARILSRRHYARRGARPSGYQGGLE